MASKGRKSPYDQATGPHSTSWSAVRRSRRSECEKPVTNRKNRFSIGREKSEEACCCEGSLQEIWSKGDFLGTRPDAHARDSRRSSRSERRWQIHAHSGAARNG